MSEFTVAGVRYRTARKMDAFVQLGVMSRLSPLLASGFGEIVPLVMELKEKGLQIADVEMNRLMQMAVPVSHELAKISDADRNYIVGECLAVVDRENDSSKTEGNRGWAPVWNREAKRAMFTEVNADFSVMLRIVLTVLVETFSPFLGANLSSLVGGVRK
jgi:hypothetical protein